MKISSKFILSLYEKPFLVEYKIALGIRPIVKTMIGMASKEAKVKNTKNFIVVENGVDVARDLQIFRVVTLMHFVFCFKACIGMIVLFQCRMLWLKNSWDWELDKNHCHLSKFELPCSNP